MWDRSGGWGTQMEGQPLVQPMVRGLKHTAGMGRVDGASVYTRSADGRAAVMRLRGVGAHEVSTNCVASEKEEQP